MIMTEIRSLFFITFDVRCNVQFIPSGDADICQHYACDASWHSSQPSWLLPAERNVHKNDSGSLFHVFSLSSFHPPISYSLYPPVHP